MDDRHCSSTQAGRSPPGPWYFDISSEGLFARYYTSHCYNDHRYNPVRQRRSGPFKACLGVRRNCIPRIFSVPQMAVLPRATRSNSSGAQSEERRSGRKEPRAGARECQLCTSQSPRILIAGYKLRIQKAQIELNHNPPNPAPAAAYLSVDDELLLLRFYCIQVSKICRHGFGLPEQVEATAISYLKRFYLKNSVMEWHPKTIM